VSEREESKFDLSREKRQALSRKAMAHYFKHRSAFYFGAWWEHLAFARTVARVLPILAGGSRAAKIVWELSKWKCFLGTREGSRYGGGDVRAVPACARCACGCARFPLVLACVFARCAFVHVCVCVRARPPPLFSRVCVLVFVNIAFSPRRS